MNLDDTIVAISTPPGRGGIGVVRLAGPESRSIALAMLRLKKALQPTHATVAELIDITKSVGTGLRPVQPEHSSEDLINLSPVEPARIDEVVVTYYAKPHSYTTDDVVEISAHGSPVLLRHIVEQSLARGARLADPGEFTMRAFLNGRIDLTQAEAVRDLIESQTLYQARVAAQQLGGALSRRLQPVKQKLVELIATLEAGIDFAEDDISVLPANRILEQIAEIRIPLAKLAASFAYGKIVHEGLTLAIVGRPNVGKSSLFNRLVEQERAIVTANPGTTRDPVSETVSIGGIPIKLIDTAGIRRALDEAESIGIQKSLEALADADLVLIVLDSSQPITTEDHDLIAKTTDRPSVVVHNKGDLKTLSSRAQQDGEPSEPPCEVEGPCVPPAPIQTSALTGQGIPELRAEILRHIAGESAPQSETGFLTNIRHQKLVTESITALDAAQTAVHHRIPHEMLLLDLYSALRPLDEITGITTTDDILNLIFTTFCIGK